MTISDENHPTTVGNMLCNSVLKTTSQVTDAKRHLKALDLFPHNDTIKSWDTYKMIDIIIKADRKSFILDVGRNDSPILPMLKRLGIIRYIELVTDIKYSRVVPIEIGIRAV